MMNFLKSLNPMQKTLGGIAALIFVIAGGWFAWWTISPLFYNVEVSEAIAADGVATLETISTGNFVDADAVHKASGVVNIIDRGDDIIVRFEDGFETTNGPDLFVWLVKDGDVDNGYVDLGRLKGNIGSQNYVLPEGTNLQEYDTVIIWCKAFSVLFGSAELASGIERGGLN